MCGYIYIYIRARLGVGMAGGEHTSTHARELDQTPTWAVSVVCAVIVLISIILEKVLHRVGEVRTKKVYICMGKNFIYINSR